MSRGRNECVESGVANARGPEIRGNASCSACRLDARGKSSLELTVTIFVECPSINHPRSPVFAGD
jgi:hypothetical protein